MLKLKDLKMICMEHEHEFALRGQGCPYRSLSNEYCDEYLKMIDAINKLMTNQELTDEEIKLLKKVFN